MEHTPHPLQKRAAAFTLTELLLVVTVIAILAALLMPVMEYTRRQAHATRCMANLRTLGSASLAFFADRKGRLYPSMFWYNISTHPTDPGMRDYVGIQEQTVLTDHPATVFTCPALKEKFTTTGADRVKRTYSVNFYAHSVDVRKRNDPDPTIRSQMQFPGTLQQIAAQSKMWMITDGTCPAVPTVNFGTYIIPTDTGIDKTFSPHGEAQIAVFFDGHVEKMDPVLFSRKAPTQAALKKEYDAFWGTLRP